MGFKAAKSSSNILRSKWIYRPIYIRDIACNMVSQITVTANCVCEYTYYVLSSKNPQWPKNWPTILSNNLCEKFVESWFNVIDLIYSTVFRPQAENLTTFWHCIRFFHVMDKELHVLVSVLSFLQPIILPTAGLPVFHIIACPFLHFYFPQKLDLCRTRSCCKNEKYIYIYFCFCPVILVMFWNLNGFFLGRCYTLWSRFIKKIEVVVFP